MAKSKAKGLKRNFHIKGIGLVKAGTPVTKEIKDAWAATSKNTPPIDNYLVDLEEEVEETAEQIE
jgi:hypothetical protein